MLWESIGFSVETRSHYTTLASLELCKIPYVDQADLKLKETCLPFPHATIKDTNHCLAREGFSKIPIRVLGLILNLVECSLVKWGRERGFWVTVLYLKSSHLMPFVPLKALGLLFICEQSLTELEGFVVLIFGEREV